MLFRMERTLFLFEFQVLLYYCLLGSDMQQYCPTLEGVPCLVPKETPSISMAICTGGLKDIILKINVYFML